MARYLRLGLLLASALVVCAQADSSQIRQSICPLSDVRAGQRAVAKSVFKGTRIQSFHVEIVGVLHKFDGTRSVILGRVLDGPVVTRNSGIISGMSGSPVYINGRLAGAIALAWAWSKEPIAGITPIEEMLEAWKPSGARTEDAAEAERRLPAPIQLGGSRISSVRVAPDSRYPDPPGVMTLVPLNGFVQASGFNQRGLSRLSELLSPYGMRVAQGPSGGTENLRPPLVPGASVGAQLVGGDFDLTALGTITLIEGNRLLAYGHPLFGLGDIDLPLTGGYVHDIMPNLQISSKIMSRTQVVGRVFRDHQSAIAGETGKKADPLPVTIEVADSDSGNKRTFTISVTRIRDLLPSLTASAVVTAIDETRGRVARGSARVTVEMEAAGRPLLQRQELSYSSGDAALAAIPAVVMPLATFIDHPLGSLRLQRVRVHVETQQARQTATIERVTVPQSRIKAGDEVTLAVTVRPYGQDATDIPLKLRLPADLPRGRLQLVVTGGSEAEQARGAIGAPRPAPVSLDQLVERYLAADRRQDLVVQIALPRAGASLLGEDLPDLPGSALNALRASHPTDLRPAASLMKLVVPTEWALSGRQAAILPLEGTGAPGPPSVPPRPTPEPPGGPSEENGEEEASVLFLDEPIMMASAGPRPRPFRAGAAQGNAKPEAAAAEKKEEKEEKPLTQPPESWVHQSRPDYADAKLSNIAIADGGRLSLAPARSDLAGIPAAVIWAAAVRSGVSYLGTGSSGLVYRVSQSGEASEFFATGELNVHALAIDESGRIYAGTSPRGKLFRISPNGVGELVYDSDSTYLWCLALGPDGTVYAGAGSPARIYAVPPEGQAKLLADLPATNVLSLVRAPSGDLYAGTSDGGVVYRVKPDGTAAAVCQVRGASVDALAIDGEGNVFASASPSGAIHRIPPAGPSVSYCDTDEQTVYGLAVLPDGDLTAATGPSGLVLRIGPDRKPRIMFRPEAGLATALAVADGSIYVGSSAPSVFRRFDPGYASSGMLESAALDAQRVARWGRLHLTAETPTGTAVVVETRSGDSASPDDHWTEWALAPDGAIASPPATRLQYRLRLTTSDPEVTPVVRQVRLTYRPQNRAPMVGLKSPSAGDYLSKKQTITWQSRDPDKDKLLYDVAISRDLGATWADLKKRLTEPKYEWDTTPTADGRCLLRVTASDAQSQPSEPEEADDAIVVWVDNTKPTALLLRASLTVAEDRRAHVNGVASDALSPIRSVEHRVDKDDWKSLPLSAVDALILDFSVTTDALEPGDHAIAVRAFDAAGNMAEDKVETTVEGTPKAKEEKPAAPEAGS